MDKEQNVLDVQLALQGDKDAFVRLVKKIEPTLYRVSKSIMRSEHECVDATQEAILIAYSSLYTLKNAEYFNTWLIRILIHECYRLVKSRKNVVPIGELIEQSQASLDHTSDQIIELKDAVNELDKDLQVAVTLYYFEDLSLKTISQLLDVPEGTVKSRLSRARQKLSELLYPLKRESGVGYE